MTTSPIIKILPIILLLLKFQTPAKHLNQFVNEQAAQVMSDVEVESIRVGVEVEDVTRSTSESRRVDMSLALNEERESSDHH